MSKFFFLVTSLLTLCGIYLCLPKSSISSHHVTPVYSPQKVSVSKSESAPLAKPISQVVSKVVEPTFDTNTEIGQLKKELYDLSFRGVPEVLKYFEDYPPGLQRMELLNFYVEITPKDQLPKLISFFEKSDSPEDFFAFKKLVEKAAMRSKDLIPYFSPEASATFTKTLREVVVDHRENENLGKSSFVVAEEIEKWIAGQKLPNQGEWINVIYGNVIASEPAKFALEKTSLIPVLSDSKKQALFERLAAKTPETYAAFTYNYSQTEKDPLCFNYFLRKWRNTNPDAAQKWLDNNSIVQPKP